MEYVNDIRPLLTIAIPTYNRKLLLKECLEAIIHELDIYQLRDKVEIIISDNASSDGTEEMLHNDFNFIEYHRNDENLGVERNVDNCFGYAHGKYTLIFSDDDIMIPGALSEIIKAMDIEPIFIHLNSISFYKKFEGFEHCSEPRMNLKENIITQDKNEYFKLVNIFITFLSTSVYRTELAQAVDRSIYDGTFTSSGQTVLHSMKCNGSYVIIAKPCVAARGGNTGGYNLFTVWVKAYKEMILGTGHKVGINDDILKSVYKRTMLQTVRGFIVAYRTTEKGLSLKNRNYIFGGIKEFPSLWFPLIVSTYAPVAVIMILRRLKKKFKAYL